MFRAARNMKCLAFSTKRFPLTPSNQTKAAFCSKGIPKNILEEVVTAQSQPENGAIHDKKPFKIELEGGKKYSWCLCGKSKNQPLCDGTHKNEFLKIKLKPVRFAVEKSGTYWLCNCKQTKHRPFCDGTHKQQHIQDAVK